MSVAIATTAFATGPALAAPAPSTPLGPFEDSAVAWTTWVTLMGALGLAAFALIAAAPVAARIGAPAAIRVTRRLAGLGALLALLAFPAVLTDVAHDAGEGAGYDYSAAWGAVFDGSAEGRLLGLELVFTLVAAALLALLVAPAPAGGRLRTAVLGGAVLASAVALGTTKFPTERPALWSRDTFETVMWMLHLIGGAVWIGGLAGLLLLALTGAIAPADRGEFWSPAIRRFSIMAMSCVGAITLSGLFLYWEHVDGPSQLFSTMYGRVLGVKILIFGALLVLGLVNQFVLHPRIEALRAGGDTRSLPVLLVREFRVTIALEVLLGLSVLFVAPFLHGSARNQAFQAHAAANASASPAKLARIAPKEAGASTWVLGTVETVAVIAVMVGGYQVSGRLVQRRRTPVARPAAAGVTAG